MNRRRPVTAVILLVLALVLAACGGSTAPTVVEPTSGRPLALVYRGQAACDGCPEAAAAMVERNGFEAHYIGPGEQVHFSAEALARAALYVQPGGSNAMTLDTAWHVLQRDRAFRPELLRDYVRHGGRYLGLCMGGYLAGNPGLGMLPGDSGQYIAAAGASVTNENDTLVDVVWRGEQQPMYFQDGPYFDLHGNGVDVLARYRSTDRIAAAVVPYGDGRIAVTGPHPEAPADWYRDYGLADRSTIGQALGDDLVRTLMR